MSVPNNPNAIRNAQRAALRARVPAEVRATNNAVRRNTRLTSPEFRRADNNRRANAHDVPGVRAFESSQRAEARNEPGIRDAENRIRRERIMNLDPQLVAENLERNAQRMRLLRQFEAYRVNERCVEF